MLSQNFSPKQNDGDIWANYLPLQWNLTNNAGRKVANGTYLVVAEVKDRNGKQYLYQTKIGVKR